MLLVYSCDTAKAVQEAKKQREAGWSVVMLKKVKDKEIYQTFADTNHFAQVIFL